MTDDSQGPTESATVEYADIEKWYRRFNRAMSMFSPEHDADGFNDLVAVSIAGVTLEAFLHIGVGFLDPAKKRDRATLGRLITLSLACGAVSAELGPLLERFCDIRNAVTHFIDYRVNDAEVDELYGLMPASGRSEVDAAKRNILDEASLGMKLRLVLMSVFHATDIDIRGNVSRALDERGVPRLAE